MINNKHEISGRRDSAVGRPSTRAYKTLFPQCEKTNSESLVRPRTIENFHTTVDYRKFIKRLLKRLWLPLLIGGVQAAAVYVLLPKLMSEKPVFASKVSLLYKTPETKDQKNLSIGTIKEMIAMENNCQGVKTTLGLDESLESIKARTSVDTRGGTNLIELTVEGENIEKTVDLANTFAEVAYRNNRSFYENKAKAIMDKSEAQLVKARVNALVAQGAFVNFKEKKNVVDIAWTTRNMVDELSETESNATQTRSQVSAYESEQAYLVKLRGEQPAKVKRLTQTENFFKNQLLSAQISLMHLKNKYSMRNAKIVQMQKEIVSLKKSIAEVEEKSKGESMETNPQIAVIKNRIARNQISLEAARGRVGEMDALLKQRREDFQRFPLIQQEYATLQTKKEASEKIVDVYEENLRLARMDYVRPHTDFEIYELATGAIKQNSFKRIIISGTAGFAGALGILLLLLPSLLLKTKISTAKEVQLNYTPPCLATIPEFKAAQLKMLNSPLTGYVQRLAEKIAINTNCEGALSIALCSPYKGAGKSLLAYELASYYANLGLKTVYLDFDQESNAVFEGTMDIKDVFHGSIHIDEVTDERENLKMVKFEAVESMYDSLRSLACKEFMEKLKDEYDVIMVDTPGILDKGYACNAIDLADYSLFTLRSGDTSRSDVDKALGILEEMHINPMGIVLNLSGKG